MSPFIRPKAIRHADRLLARAVFLILLAVYTATFNGLPDNPDAEVEFQTTSAIVREHTLAIGGTPEADGILAAGFDVVPGAGERADRRYSWFGVGQALFAVPLYLVGAALGDVFSGIQGAHRATTHYGVGRSEYFQHLVVGWRNPLLSALTAWLLVHAARRAGASRKSAFVAGLTYGLCTYAWPQARSTLSDVQATFFLFLAFHLLLRAREGFERFAGPRRGELAGVGAALGCAFLTRVITAPAIAVLLLVLLVVLVRGRRRLGAWGALLVDLVVAALPALACLALFAYLNQVRFGDPLESGYGAAVDAGFFGYPPLRGLLGLLASPGRGLVWLAPGLLLLLPWLRSALRHRELFLPACVLLVTVAIVGPIAFATPWHGGRCYGPRYVLPALPFLWLGVSLGLDVAAKRAAGRFVARAVLGLGLLTSLPAVLVDYTTQEDLALQAAQIAWPEVPGATHAERENVRFDRLQWDWRFAAPWAHWRIFRHRMARLGEDYSVRAIYYLDDDAVVRPAHERELGFRHIAWVDLRQRLGGQAWPAVLGCVVLLVVGVVTAARGFDPTLR